ncbi:hypothetical protein PV325_006981 [Microctonus aethiopoides]|nr:hypothetical protein PV325_006981 [Microctonus aethiopoides]KAK0096182.1 hypothetical protein PV326_006222 [Microctonus aethiopoides]
MACDNSSDNNDIEIDNCSDNGSIKVSQKKKKRGIIYLSQIPKYMNVTTIREFFAKYGQLGRVYLQLGDKTNDPTNPDKKRKKKRKEATRYFTEGWIEFESKKIAKYVANTLNNKQISTRKRSKLYDTIWNIKYLPRFKWIHLSERLAYEKAVHKQRLRAEISQAKREVNFFSHNIDRSKKLRAKAMKETGETSTFVLPNVKQRETDMEIRSKKSEVNNSEDRTQFLKSLFS